MRLILLVCFLMGMNSVSANSRFDSAIVRHFTDQDGLPQNSIKYITPDKDGFVWLATEDGLVRFDGYHFLNFNSTVLPIKDNHFLCFLSTNEGLAAISVENILEIKNGKAAVSNISAYNYFIQEDTSDVYTVRGFPDLYLNIVPCHYFIYPVNATTYYKTSKDSIWYVNNEQHFYLQKAPAFKPEQLFALNGNLYQITDNGEFFQLNSKFPRPLSLHGDSIGKLKNYKVYWNIGSQQLFLSINNLLYYLKIDKNNNIESTILLDNFDQVKGGITSIYYDTKYQRLFIGSLTKGLFVYKCKQFSVLRDGEGNDEVYYAQALHGDNALVVPRGFMFTTDGTKKEIPLLRKIGRLDNYSIATDNKENNWYKDGRVLYKLTPDYSAILWDTVFPSKVNQLFFDGGNKLWIGTQTTGLYTIQTDEEHPQLQQFCTDINDCTYFTKANEHTLWVGTAAGLYSVDVKTKKTSGFNVLKDSYIRSLFTAPTGEIWITTYSHGIFIYKDNEITALPLDKHRFLLMAHCVIRDNNGYNWITTNKGLFQVSTNDALSFVSKKSKNLYYLYYRKEQGFNTNEFNGGCQPCAVKLPNGDISLPSLNGLVYFNPGNIIPELPDKRIFVDQIEIDTSVINPDEVIDIPHNFHHAKIRISSPYFGDPDNLHFYYSLEKEGNKDEILWVPVNNERIIEFSSMSSGTYHLWIRKPNGFGGDNEAELILVLKVEKAFYETTIFRIALLVTLAFIIFVFFRIRVRRIERKNEQLSLLVDERTYELRSILKNLQASEQQLRKQSFVQQRIIAAISHDLKTPMKYLMQVVGTTGYPIVKEERMVIHDSLHNMYYLVENLIQYIKSQFAHDNSMLEVVDLYNELELKASIFRPVANSKKILVNNITIPGTKVLVNKQLLSIIIHNLIDNAVKNTPAGSITLEAYTENQKIVLIFADTGIGMPQAVMNWINQDRIANSSASEKYNDVHVGIGLLMVIELLALINGSMKVNTNGLHGALVTITIDVIE
ncbi:hypothetical protein DVR12_21215 [Chitinophaga silvatica]|uniref:Histidine kinase domain-containing protein n=1 Tax=Chitinophaga silvatica TaxID=2282649 RepID=A0A3E1Y578_9BACT|nr:ATP-binding protein [Chitinophaga silvatica]RFS19627.1 hypothetical protein DVR12_21215 [Chitinophaga silvatica]